MSNKKNPVMELMVPITWIGYKIRVWWTDDGSECSSIRRGIKQLLETKYLGGGSQNVAKLIASFSDNVAAVEVLHDDGDGCVFYPDWK